MTRFLLLFGFILFLSLSASAQTDCLHPSGCVLISREAALKALADADRVQTLEAVEKAKDQAVSDLRDELNKMRIEFARTSGELTALKQNAVCDRAIIELMLKMVRKKCMPLSICF